MNFSILSGLSPSTLYSLISIITESFYCFELLITGSVVFTILVSDVLLNIFQKIVPNKVKTTPIKMQNVGFLTSMKV